MSYKEQILSSINFPDGELTLAFSGGSDSLALLSLLPKERSRALYVNHNIRGDEELEREIELNKKNAERFNIPLKIVTIEKGEVERYAKEKGIGIEAAARKLRYSILLNEECSWILTAHHMDDQAETIIMRILQQSPIYRFEGIKRVNGKIYRPLLTVSKSLINSYIEEEGLKYSRDSTNDDNDYKRNYIRHSILPKLSEEDKRRLLNISLNIQEINKREKKIDATFGFSVSFCIESFLSSSALKKEDLLFSINRYFGHSALLSRSELEKIEKSIEKKTGYIGSRFTLKIQNESARFFPPSFNIALDGRKSFEHKGLKYTIDDQNGDDKTLLIDFEKIKGSLVFRNNRPGDVIELKEGRKELSDLRKEYKVPYFFILEDQEGIIAIFSRFLGGKDRLNIRFLGKKGLPVTLSEVIFNP